MYEVTDKMRHAYELFERKPFPQNPTSAQIARSHVAAAWLASEGKREAARKAAITRSTRKSDVHDERYEQTKVAQWLDEHIGELNWFHPPNESRRTKRYGADLKRQGMKAGVLDIVITARCPRCPWARGVAIEMKRVNGTRSDITRTQWDWIEAQQANGWICHVAFGHKEAIRILEVLGWGPGAMNV